MENDLQFFTLDNNLGYGVRETASLPPEKVESPDHPMRVMRSSTECANGQSSSTEDNRFNFPRSQSDVFGPGTSGSRERPITRCNTSTSDILDSRQLGHISAGTFWYNPRLVPSCFSCFLSGTQGIKGRTNLSMSFPSTSSKVAKTKK